MTKPSGAVLAEEENLKAPASQKTVSSATEVIGPSWWGSHPHSGSKDKRSFEALSAIVHRPENIYNDWPASSQDWEQKVSAQDDNLATIKTYLFHAACWSREWIKNTVVTALLMGPLNCWSVILSLVPSLQQLICILDWFHIAKQANVRLWSSLPRHFGASQMDFF